MFWVVSILLTGIVLAKVFSPLLSAPVVKDTGHDVAFYKAQWADLENDVTRGVISAEEAERAKTEIARRLLAAAEAPKKTFLMASSKVSVMIIACATVGTAYGAYWMLGAQGYPDMPLKERFAQAEDVKENRPSQSAAESAAHPQTPPDFPEDYQAAVQRLRSLMPDRHDDLKGWEMLAYHEARMRNFPAAADAQAKVIEIKGKEVETFDIIRQTDLLVAAADGYVSPEAEVAIQQALAMEPNSIPARYYLGLMYDQTGRPDLAFRLWRTILDSGMSQNVYGALIQEQIARTAFFAGVDYKLPSPQPELTLPGPDAEMMAAAAEMSATDRQDMISGMVSGLAERLASEGGPPAEWARLVNAYNVLGETSRAQTVLAEALTVFSESPDAIAMFQQMGKQIGHTE